MTQFLSGVAGEFVKIASSDLHEPLIVNQIWLREHCACPQCHNKVANQRMYSVFDANMSEIKPKNVSANGTELNITCKLRRSSLPLFYERPANLEFIL